MQVLADLAPHQQAMCRIFDNTYEWMLNAFNTPFIAYVGEIDGSFRKHVNARRQLAQEGFHFEGESFTTGLRVTEVPSIVRNPWTVDHTGKMTDGGVALEAGGGEERQPEYAIAAVGTADTRSR